MNNFRLVAILSDRCRHSHNFKNDELSNLREGVENINNLSLEYIYDSPSSDPSVFTTYPPDLKNYTKWYPLFLLVTEESWQRCLRNPTEKLECRIFNGPVTNDGYPSNTAEKTSSNILKWAQEEMDNARMRFNSSPSVHSQEAMSLRGIYDSCRNLFNREVFCL